MAPFLQPGFSFSHEALVPAHLRPIGLLPHYLYSPSSTSCPPLCYRGSPVAREGPRPPSAAPSDGNKKRSSSIASALGLKKLFSALGHTSRLKLAKACSYTEEQQQPEAPGPASHSSTPKVKRAPSLQFLHLVSPQGPPKGS